MPRSSIRPIDPRAMTRRELLRTALLLPAGFVAASCSTQAPTSPSASNMPANASAGPATSLFTSARKPEGPVRIQIITNGISPFWTPMAVGMKKAASELPGCEAEWAGPDPASVSNQKQLVENALAKGVDGIAISCIEAGPSVPIIEMVLERNVPIITFDSDSTGSRRLCYIGTNNVNAGKAAGEAAVKLLPNGGKFVAFVGNISAENARERRQGFEEASRAHGIEIVEIFEDNKDANRARKNVEDAIARFGGEIQGFLGLYSYNGPAIAQAVQNSGQRARYKIVCFDAEPVTLQELEKGNIDATIVQKPYDFGYLSTKLLYLINRSGWETAKAELNIPDDGRYDTGVKVITPANVRQYRDELKALGVESS